MSFIFKSCEKMSQVSMWLPSDMAWDPPSDNPFPRSHHSAVSVGTHILIFGGEDSDGNLLDDLLMYQYDPPKWFPRVKQSGDAPPALHYHQAVIVEQKMYIIGGKLQNGEPNSRMYILDTSEFLILHLQKEKH
jgi:N-acetylneuraminic acid mutarotase